MAAKVVSTVKLNFTAGTAELFSAIDQSNAKIIQFSRNVSNAKTPITEFHKANVSGTQASAAALRVLEGGFTNNLRAAERFTSSVLGLGPLLQAAFPLVGGIAFIGLLGRMGDELYKLYSNLTKAPEASRGAFNQLSAGIAVTNDQLELTNVQLENQIAKLSGKRENTLKEALYEARLEADKLAESLAKDVEQLYKVLAEHKPGISQRILDMELGRAPWQATGAVSMLQSEIGGTTGTGGGGFEERLATIRETGHNELSAAAQMPTATKAEQAAASLAKANAQQKMQNALTAEYKAQITQVDAALKPLVDLQRKQWDQEAAAEKLGVPRRQAYIDTNVDWSVYIEPIRALRHQLTAELTGVGDQFTHTALQAAVKGLARCQRCRKGWPPVHQQNG